MKWITNSALVLTGMLLVWGWSLFQGVQAVMPSGEPVTGEATAEATCYMYGDSNVTITVHARKTYHNEVEAAPFPNQGIYQCETIVRDVEGNFGVFQTRHDVTFPDGLLTPKSPEQLARRFLKSGDSSE